MDLLMNLVRGFCMALADSVPGVSGGTIAFILGFYDRFIGSLAKLVKGTAQERKEAVLFLAKLLAGWVIGFCASVLVLGSVFDSHIYELSSLFLGLSLFALPLVIWEERETLKGNYQNLIFLLVGAAFVVLITLFQSFGNGSDGVDLAHLTPGLAVYIFLVSMVAISAMVLPGISGSTVLLIFGLYVPVINGIRELLHFNFTYFLPILICGLGIVVGVLLVIKLVRAGLEKKRSVMIYLILGLMIGAMYAIAMGPTTLDDPQPAMTLGTFQPFFFLVGGVILFGLQGIKAQYAKREQNV